MQIKTIHGNEYAIVREEQLGTADGVMTVTDAIPLSLIQEASKEPGFEQSVYPVTFITFKSNQNQVVS